MIQRIERAVIANGAGREAIARRVQRDGMAELVVIALAHAEIDVVGACVALADCRRERGAAKAGIGEADEMHRTPIGVGRAWRAVIEGRSHRQQRAVGVE